MAHPDDPTPFPASYSTAEVARRFGVSIPTVQRWVDQGHLKAWKTVGGHRRVDAESAERFFHSQGRKPLSVLIVDDNPDDRDVLCALVETAAPGAALITAENGFQGLLAIGQNTPDVLITDIVMPHMNGVEMLRQLCDERAARPRIVIAVSSKSPDQFASMGTLPAEVRFLAKPVDPQAFVQMLQAALSSRSAPAA